MQYSGKNQEVLLLESIENQPHGAIAKSISGGLTFLWFLKKQAIKLDGEKKDLLKNQIVCLTEFHKLEAIQFNAARIIRFNRAFYCIKDHDDEVSCKGLLFYSASEVPIITIPASEINKFDILWKMFTIEMATADNLQFEMLQMMLKRFIILCTRIYKSQQPVLFSRVHGSDIVREFNYLVEAHFKKLHTVSAYASMLNKSPKTISNIFARHGRGTPHAIIHERIMLEARRLLRYTDKSIKEIAFELGYDDLQSFSRAFWTKVGTYPSEFRSTKI